MGGALDSYYTLETPFSGCPYPLLGDSCNETYASKSPRIFFALRVFGVIWSGTLLLATALEVYGVVLQAVDHAHRRGQRTSRVKQWCSMRSYKARAIHSLALLCAVNVVRAIDVRGSSGILPAALELVLDQVAVILSTLIASCYVLSVLGIVTSRTLVGDDGAGVNRALARLVPWVAFAVPAIVLVLAALDGLPGKAGVYAFSTRFVVLGCFATVTGVFAASRSLPTWRQLLFQRAVAPSLVRPAAPRRLSYVGSGSAGALGGSMTPVHALRRLSGDATVLDDSAGQVPRLLPPPSALGMHNTRGPDGSSSDAYGLNLMDTGRSAAGEITVSTTTAPMSQIFSQRNYVVPATEPALTPPAASATLMASAPQLGHDVAPQALSIPPGSTSASVQTDGVRTSGPQDTLGGVAAALEFNTETNEGTTNGSQVYGGLDSEVANVVTGAWYPGVFVRRQQNFASADSSPELSSDNLRRVSGPVLRVMIASVVVNLMLFGIGIVLILFGAISFSSNHPASLLVQSPEPAAFWASFNMICSFWAIPPLMLCVLSSGAMRVAPYRYARAVAVAFRCMKARPAIIPRPSRRRRSSDLGSARVAAPLADAPKLQPPATLKLADLPDTVTPIYSVAPSQPLAPAAIPGVASSAMPMVSGVRMAGNGLPLRKISPAIIVVSEPLAPITEEEGGRGDLSGELSRTDAGLGSWHRV